MNYMGERAYPCTESKDNDISKGGCLFPKHPDPKRILLECGCNPQDAIFEINDDHVKHDQTFVLNSVIIDTTCLNRPLVKIDFSSIIYFEAEAKNGCERELEVDLLFELIRICKCEKECVQSWRYIKEYKIEHDDKLEVKVSEPFTVTFCDRVCPDCCEYKMVVKGNDFDGDFDALRIVKPSISALAQGLCDN